MNTIVIATDGSCLRRRGPGGWAAIIQHPLGETVYVGHAARTTSNRMELAALLGGLEGLAALPDSRGLAVTVLTDSASLARGLNGAIGAWMLRPSKDADLWRAIAAALPAGPVNATWVPSRQHRLNQQADALARSAALFADRGVQPAIHWA